MRGGILVSLGCEVFGNVNYARALGVEGKVRTYMKVLL